MVARSVVLLLVGGKASKHFLVHLCSFEGKTWKPARARQCLPTAEQKEKEESSQQEPSPWRPTRYLRISCFANSLLITFSSFKLVTLPPRRVALRAKASRYLVAQPDEIQITKKYCTAMLYTRFDVTPIHSIIPYTHFMWFIKLIN